MDEQLIKTSYYDLCAVNEIHEYLMRANDIVLKLYKDYERNFDMVQYGSVAIHRACEENGTPIYPLEPFLNKLVIDNDDIPIKFHLKQINDYNNDIKIMKGNITFQNQIKGYNKWWSTYELDEKLPLDLDPWEMFFWVFKVVCDYCFTMEWIEVYNNNEIGLWIKYQNVIYEVKVFDFT